MYDDRNIFCSHQIIEMDVVGTLAETISMPLVQFFFYILTMDQMAVQVNGDEPTDNYQSTLLGSCSVRAL